MLALCDLCGLGGEVLGIIRGGPSWGWWTGGRGIPSQRRGTEAIHIVPGPGIGRDGGWLLWGRRAGRGCEGHLQPMVRGIIIARKAQNFNRQDAKVAKEMIFLSRSDSA